MKNTRETRISKYIALLLRHQPEKAGLVMDEHGWVRTDDLIRGVSESYDFDRELLEKIVREDEKQRYAFNEDHSLIRASQGHSIPVDVQLQVCEPPEYLFHGTGEKYLQSIQSQGLLPKSRLYVHLSADPDTAYKTGQRHGRSVVLTVRAREMRDAGHIFYRSANGVWLCEKVPAAYLIFPEGERK